MGKMPFFLHGEVPLWKLHIWEVATWEIVTWEVALGKMPLGKYLTPTISIYSYNILFKNQFYMYTVHGTMSNVDL